MQVCNLLHASIGQNISFSWHFLPILKGIWYSILLWTMQSLSWLVLYLTRHAHSLSIALVLLHFYINLMRIKFNYVISQSALVIYCCLATLVVKCSLLLYILLRIFLVHFANHCDFSQQVKWTNLLSTGAKKILQDVV